MAGSACTADLASASTYDAEFVHDPPPGPPPQHSQRHEEYFPPPPGPPPLLSLQDLTQLAQHGHLALTLPSHLTDLYDQLFSLSSTFFEQSSASKSSQYPPSQGTELGYNDITGEKEYLSFRHSYPSPQNREATSPSRPRSEASSASAPGNPSLDPLVASLWSETTILLHRILADISAHLGIPASVWDSILDGCMALPPSLDTATPTLLRVFNYLPDSGIADRHRDLGLLTLCVCRGAGLETFSRDSAGPQQQPTPATVSTTSTETPNSSSTQVPATVPTTPALDSSSSSPDDGTWSPAPSVTLLVGDTLHLLSSRRLASGVHRVVGNPLGRRSVVFALRASTRHDIDLVPFGGEGAVGSGVLWEAVRKRRVNVNERKEVRERARARNAAAARAELGTGDGDGEEAIVRVKGAMNVC